MGGHLVMSEKERLRKTLMEMVHQGKIKLNKAARQCNLGYRQAKRVYRKYKLQTLGFKTGSDHLSP